MTEASSAGAMGRAERLGRLAETSLLCAALLAMVGLATLQIIMRDAFGAGFGWADEALRVLVLWVGMLGAVVASREHRHLAVDLISLHLTASSRRRVLVVVDACTTAICCVLAWISWNFVAESVKSGERLVEVIPAWAIQSILPAAFLLMAYRYLVWTARRLGAKPLGDSAAGAETPDATS